MNRTVRQIQDVVQLGRIRIVVQFGQSSRGRESIRCRTKTYQKVHQGSPRDPVVPPQKVFAVGARRVQVPSEKVRLESLIYVDS